MWSKHHIYTGSAFPDNILLILRCGQFLKHIQCLKSTEDELIQLLTEAFSVYAVSCSPSPPPLPAQCQVKASTGQMEAYREAISSFKPSPEYPVETCGIKPG